MGLGIMPAWQYSQNPAVNPKLRMVDFPIGMRQTTIQPIGPYYRSYATLSGGLGHFDQPTTLITVGLVIGSFVAGAFACKWWKRRRR